MKRAVLLCIALIGCAGGSASPHVPVRPLPPASVAAGSEIHATLRDDVSTRDARPGDWFVAHVDRPLVAVDGRTIVTAGSILRGHVVRVSPGSTGRPRIEIAFDTVETRDGPVRVNAQLVDVGGQGEVVMLRLNDEADGAIEPSERLIGGGPGAEGRAPEVTLPTGTRLRVLLLDPVVPLDRR
ncbi:MAG: hypothetical protein HYV09_03735 [Deltaproteobacteria bacterium]|nr:hypothetical protein [Deltaproteobacteria bacterium]